MKDNKISANSQLQHLHAALESARRYLPSQGPIGVFIHHNTLHDFENMTFEDAVRHVATVRGTQPYLLHSEYLTAMRRGRILEDDLAYALQHSWHAKNPKEQVLTDEFTRYDLWNTAIRVESDGCTEEQIEWFLDEKQDSKSSDLRQMLEIVLRRVAPFAPKKKNQYGLTENPKRERADSTLIWLLTAFFDQGIGHWKMPGRENGFYDVAVNYFKADAEWKSLTAEQACLQLLLEMKIPEEDWQTAILDTLLPFSGWAGLMAVLGERPKLASVKASLMDFLAVKLFLDRKIGVPREAWRKSVPSSILEFAWYATLVLSKAGIDINVLLNATDEKWTNFCQELEDFDDIARRGVLHIAYEHRYRQMFYEALNRKEHQPVHNPSYQMVFCLDEREESFRRHIEEKSSETETFGIAGFYGVDMRFQPHDHHEAIPLCPVAIDPQNFVVEKASSIRRRDLYLKNAQRHVYKGTRGLVTGQMLSLLTGMAAAVPMLTGTVSLRPFRRRVEILTAKKPKATTLDVGFSLKEMVDRVEGVLRSMGLTKNFAKLIFIFGHGSTSTNNPFQSAYDCGACGGQRGNHNARVFALMANRKDVRLLLAERGLEIPPSTYFIGGVHDTCSDHIELYDTAMIPEEHQSDYRKSCELLDEACERNAHERVRRFNGTKNMNGRQAKVHVESRARSLSEPRPEYGHGSNAACVIGRRSLTKGLFLDRRSFLTSYDCTQDPDAQILTDLLSAVTPVCAGISLEYYFSRVDNQIFGCGTKLPHNVTGLVGIMDGHASDLRTGLPWQTVEIHEPMRLLMVLEAKVEQIELALKRLPAVSNLVHQGWMQLGMIEPVSGKIFHFEDGAWVSFRESTASVLKHNKSNSYDYYFGRDGHLEPAKLSIPTTAKKSIGGNR